MTNSEEFMNDENMPRRPQATRAQRPLVLVGLPEALSPQEERDLIKLGSEEAHQKVIVHAMRAACSYGQKVCKGNVDGEDIFSACYDALRHAVVNYRLGKKSFSVYAKTYVRGEVIKAWKAQKAVKKSSFMVQMQNDDTDDDLLAASNGEFDFEGVHRREQLALLRKIIDEHLSEQERLVLELRAFGQLTFITIKDLLGCSRTNVQQIYDRAVKKIKKRVAALQRTAQYKV